ncbi:DUF6923 family protein [Corynebacterium lizhenjunii]|uniref:DUF6923 family protein n=1 Tax=Corynebacterium lizhenjunii TaxID=2709394 RepID=UPI0013ED2354|nr:SpaA isopeptide-forming pilin-related protein [Corynebacterium lizhenjunii]
MRNVNLGKATALNTTGKKILAAILALFLALGLASYAASNAPQAQAQGTIPVNDQRVDQSRGQIRQSGRIGATGRLNSVTFQFNYGDGRFAPIISSPMRIQVGGRAYQSPASALRKSGATYRLTYTIPGGQDVTKDQDISLSFRDERGVGGGGYRVANTGHSITATGEVVQEAKEWASGNLTTTATQGSSSLVTMTEEIDRSGRLDGQIFARVQHKNGYDIEGGKDVTFKVLDGAGRVVYTRSARPNASDKIMRTSPALEGEGSWGGIINNDSRLKEGIQVEPGYRIVAELPFGDRNGDRKDPSVRSPLGPGSITYTITEPLPPQEWELDNLTTTATQGSSSLVTMTEEIDRSGLLHGQIFARVQHKNGYDIEGGKDVTFKVLDRSGRVVYTSSAKPNADDDLMWTRPALEGEGSWGGIIHNNDRLKKQGIQVEPGYRIVAELPFGDRDGDRKDPSVRSPLGPGSIEYRVMEPMPTRCEAGGPQVERRLPPRELSNEERQRGTSVYVTASEPRNQGRNRSQLYLQTSVAGDFVPVGEPNNWVVNALAYNPADNWLYAISQGRIGKDAKGLDTRAINGQQALFYEDPCYPAGHLLQINPLTGAVHDLGKVTKTAGNTAQNSKGYGFQGEYGQAWPNDLWGGINVGVFDSDGGFWVANGSLSGTGALYNVNLDSVSAKTQYSFDNQIRKGGDYGKAHRTASEDYAVLPGAGNYAWGIVNGWNSDDRQSIYIERIDLKTGQSKRWNITDMQTEYGAKIRLGNQWSKAWTYGDGTLGFGTGSSGANSDVIRIQVTNPTADNPMFELASVIEKAPTAYNTNGTSNGYSSPFDTDLEIIKHREEIRDGRIYWWIDAWNNGPDGISGFSLRDKVTQDFSDLRKEEVVFNTKADIPYLEQQRPDGLTIEFGQLPARAADDDRPQVSVKVSAKLNDDAPDRCVSNTATVVNNEKDTNIDNNTFTSTCDIIVEKSVVDTNNNREVDSKDVQGPDKDGKYTVFYDVKVTNRGTEKTSYNRVVDTPRFSEAFAVETFAVKRPGAQGFEVLKGEEDAAPEGGSYTLGGPGVLDKGASAIYQVRVVFKADEGKLEANKDLGTCEGDTKGLLNAVNVDGSEDDACVDFPTPQDMTVKIVKMRANSPETSPISGADFAVYPATEDGTLDTATTEPITLKDGASGTFTVQLKAPGTYFLLETRAPAGLSLLSQPVKFTTEWVTKGDTEEPSATIVDGGSTLITAGTEDSSAGKVAIIKVADVQDQTGTLPRTGGWGVGLPLAASLGLLLAGCAYAVRRRA